MFMRRFFLPAILLAAIGGPYMYSGGGFESAKQSVSSLWKQNGAKTKSDSTANLEQASFQSTLASTKPASIQVTDGPPATEPHQIQDLHEILRFDVTPDWIMSRWPRVTTNLADLDLEGMRVPLMTGTRPDDLAGSLTYYFDKHWQVQRISFNGTTGDDRRLVALIVKSYGLRPEPSLNRGLYLAKWNGIPKSALRIRLVSVVRSEAPPSHLQIEMELNRPGVHYKLNDAFAESLRQDQVARIKQ